MSGAGSSSTFSERRRCPFVEVVVNGPKTWSLAAALHGDVAAA